LYLTGPGLFFILPCIDTYSKVDLRTVTFDVPPQEILTKDSVTVAVDAVVYFRIFNSVISITNVEDAAKSTKLLAATTLRNVISIRVFFSARYFYIIEIRFWVLKHFRKYLLNEIKSIMLFKYKSIPIFIDFFNKFLFYY
jgi:hypothetical protein